ncbi:MAG: PEGA domain-containing protein [Methanomicrobiales archaeon]|nr:PEGA domain-containing protein [Methanomicrobiales archaeon]
MKLYSIIKALIILILVSCTVFFTGISAATEIVKPEIPGMYSIISEPSGAEAFINNTSLGLTPLIYIPNSDLQVPFEIEIRKQGYIVERRTISEIPRISNTLTLSFFLELSPQFGRIVVSAKPDGSLVSLNSQKTVEVPYTFEKVPIGNHSVTVTKSGYKPYTNPNVLVKPDIDTKLRIFLISNVEKKVLVVTTTPPDAEILVDGIYRGTTLKDIPLLIGPLTDGSHSVQARMKGYKDVFVEVITQEFVSTNLDLALIPMNANPVPATLRIRTKPYGADIYLSSIWIGQTPPFGYFELKNLPPARYSLTFSLIGYQNSTEWIHPLEGETITMDRELIPQK